MKKVKQHKEIPVSQRQLAQYLGVSTSMMNMSQSSRYPLHQLSSGSSIKMAELLISHLQVQRSRVPGASWIKMRDSFKHKAEKIIQKLALEASFHENKSAMLKRRLAEMVLREQADRQWLHTVDHLLEKLPRSKERQADQKWLANQQAIVETRLQKNGILSRVKLQMQIGMDKAKSQLSRAAIQELKKEMNKKLI